MAVSWQPQRAPRHAYSRVTGVQTAVVVGPEGESVYTDDYGRVRIKFHWDRNPDNSEHSGFWVQVLQPLSDAQWGAQWLPRIGQEVLVDFIDENRYQPVVIASLYNGKQPPPFDCPNDEGVSGIRTQVEDSAHPERHHELAFNDNPLAERLSLHVDSHYEQQIVQDYTETVVGDASQQVEAGIQIHSEEGSITFDADELELNVQGHQLLMNAEGIALKPNGGTVQLLAEGGGDLRGAARVSDAHDCPEVTDLVPHEGLPIDKGSPNVIANHLAVARVGDTAPCHSGTDTITDGVDSITINGQAVAFQGSKTAHGGVILEGSDNVLVGERGPSWPLDAIKPMRVNFYYGDVSCALFPSQLNTASFNFFTDLTSNTLAHPTQHPDTTRRSQSFYYDETTKVNDNAYSAQQLVDESGIQEDALHDLMIDNDEQQV